LEKEGKWKTVERGASLRRWAAAQGCVERVCPADCRAGWPAAVKYAEEQQKSKKVSGIQKKY